MAQTHHVAQKKKAVAKSIQQLIIEYPIIAAVNMENLPAPQLQQMRAQLRGKIELAMTKRRIMKHAIDEIKSKKQNIESLEPYLLGMPALIFTRENPFSLFRTLKKSKTAAPAKAGQTAPADIKVLKGPTSFAPGPVIGELAMLGIKSGVEGGKVAIKEDSVVVKAGQKISQKAAEILTRLGIQPMEVGLNVTAVYENGMIYTREVLDIDDNKFKADLEQAGAWAFNLAIESAYTTKLTINTLLGKAFNDSKALGISQNIIDEGIVDELMAKAERSALSLKTIANIEVSTAPKAAVQESTKKEESIDDAPEIKKEEEVLEAEKELMKEEKELQRKANKKEIESDVEEEVKKEVAEEEEKLLEQERMDKDKELETNDKKIAELAAKKSKKHAPNEQEQVEKLAQDLKKKGTLRA